MGGPGQSGREPEEPADGEDQPGRDPSDPEYGPPPQLPEQRQNASADHYACRNRAPLGLARSSVPDCHADGSQTALESGNGDLRRRPGRVAAAVFADAGAVAYLTLSPLTPLPLL